MTTTRHAVAPLLLALVLPAHAAAQQHAMHHETTPPQVVRVSASASADRAPDQATLMLAVETMASTAREATQQNAQQMDALIAALRRAGLEGADVQTISYDLYPEYRHDRDGMEEPRVIGYRASNMVRVTIDRIDGVGGIIDAAIAAGADRIMGLSYSISNPDEARMQALQEAVTKARAEAEAIATALGMRLGEVLEVSTTYGGGPMPMYAEARGGAVMAPPPPPTPVEPGSVSVHASVSAVFRLAPR